MEVAFSTMGHRSSPLVLSLIDTRVRAVFLVMLLLVTSIFVLAISSLRIPVMIVLVLLAMVAVRMRFQEGLAVRCVAVS